MKSRKVTRKGIVMHPVRIDTAAIPKVELRVFCSAIADLAERLMADPKHRAEFEAWQKARNGTPPLELDPPRAARTSRNG